MHLTLELDGVLGNAKYITPFQSGNVKVLLLYVYLLL